MRIANGGGFGDPLEREAEDVARDVAEGRFSSDEATRHYGVVLSEGRVDDAATTRKRTEMREDRLRRAEPPVRPVSDGDLGRSTDGGEWPLYPGVVQRGAVAYSLQSGAPLAVAPDHWTDGCPVLEERRRDGGPDVVLRSYLDPRNGRALHVEATIQGEPRGFEVSPRRWIRMARSPS
jgi:N-methylhydantoinase B